MIQGLLVLNYDTYVYERWHGTLLYWAILCVATVVTIYGSRILPSVENISMVLHVTLFIVLLVAMAVVSPTKHSVRFVFTAFENNSGWSNDGLAWCIGLLSSCYVLTGESTSANMFYLLTNRRLRWRHAS